MIPRRLLYLNDERLSLNAKGVFSIILNESLESTLSLYRNDGRFGEAIAELRQFGYVGHFGSDYFEVSPTIAQPSEGAIEGAMRDA